MSPLVTCGNNRSVLLTVRSTASGCYRAAPVARGGRLLLRCDVRSNHRVLPPGGGTLAVPMHKKGPSPKGTGLTRGATLLPHRSPRRSGYNRAPRSAITCARRSELRRKAVHPYDSGASSDVPCRRACTDPRLAGGGQASYYSPSRSVCFDIVERSRRRSAVPLRNCTYRNVPVIPRQAVRPARRATGPLWASRESRSTRAAIGPRRRRRPRYVWSPRTRPQRAFQSRSLRRSNRR